jgi:glycosyltransferase involved in cell wall biosynthesis
VRIVVCPSDRDAVGYYRLGLPAQTLLDQGELIEFSFLPGLPLNQHKLTGEPVGLAEGFDPDIVILQRPMASWQPKAVDILKRAGIRVIVELDDNLHATDPRSQFGSQLTRQHLNSLRHCLRNADLITVSTPALAARYAQGRKHAILPNYIPEAWLHINADRTDTAVGWTGSIGSHTTDLQATRGGIGLALRHHNAIFRCYGQGNQQAADRIKQALHLPSQPDIQPWQTRETYPYEIAKLTVGVAPLADTAFNTAKSWLKPLEYAALAIPTVMSPTPEYERIHTYGIGLLAKPRSRDWQHHTHQLLSDESLRNHLSEQGRQAVRDHLTIEANAWKYAEAWESVIDRKAAAA